MIFSFSYEYMGRMAIFLHILPNMENVIFKSVHKITLELHFLNLETTFYSSIFKLEKQKWCQILKYININIIFSTFKFKFAQ